MVTIGFLHFKQTLTWPSPPFQPGPLPDGPGRGAWASLYDVGERLPKTLFHYADRLTISKDEYKALKRKAEYLIPMDKLFDVVGDGPTELWEMAERLEVDQALMEFRLKMVSQII